MITYDVIEILSGNVVLSDVAYEDCINCIENFCNNTLKNN
jgi:hypothetical protein